MPLAPGEKLGQNEVMESIGVALFEEERREREPNVGRDGRG
jgi:hypothetical protein